MQFESPFFDAIWQHKVRFLAVFFVIFTLSYGMLYALDWLPEPKLAKEMVAMNATTTTATTTQSEEEETPAESVDDTEEPVVLRIPSLDRVVTVLNPETRDIVALDAELLHGVVRHPDSALLGEEGNVLILGHSSYLPNVMNKNFQALNGIQKMKWGDIVELDSDGTRYTYRVEKVYKEQASDVVIPTDVKGERLTLVTCNSFGSKEDRFIVEAKLLNQKPL